MDISLTPQLQELVDRKLASGLYHSANEVIREALALLEERDRLRTMRLEELQNELGIGLEQLERGRSRPLERSVIDRIKAVGRERLATRDDASPS